MSTNHTDALYRNRQSGVRLPLAAGSALAFALLAGCSGQGAIRSASAAPFERAEGARASDFAKADRSIAKVEAVVARAPQDAAARAELGRAYLAAGRFESAQTALTDAMTLGDDSGRTALSLALAFIGAGQPRAAVSLLDEHRAAIPAGDLGLALALAGDTSRGVAILADAVRGGENTPKLRQNLAYAYALDGRWVEAKIMAAQDVPADQLDKRMAIWTLSALPGRNRERVAGLIGAPVRMDQGQPAALALKVENAAPRVAAAQAEPDSPAELPAVAAAADVPAPVGATVASNLEAQTAPVAPQIAAPAATPVMANPAPTFASVAEAFSAHDVRTGRFERVKATPTARVSAVAATLARPIATGSQVVQLGAFSSEQGARRAWTIYTRQNPKLGAYRPVIVPALVKGKQVWRVAAGGFAGRFAAIGLCAQLKSRGGACFAYALPARAMPLPAAPGRDVSAPQRARR